MAKKITMKLVWSAIVIALALGITATVYANDSREKTLAKIEELYANEKNADLRELEISALKDCVYPEKSLMTGYTLLKKGLDSAEMRYKYCTIGIDKGFPRNGSFDNEAVVVGKEHNQKMISEYQQQIDEIYDFVKNVVMTEGKSDEEKIAIIHNVVAEKLTYDFEELKTYKLSDVLRSNKAICTGYSNLFYILAINCGIDCECVGNPGHMWNRVWLNNSWKHVDVTNNDYNERLVCYLVDESALDAEHQLMDCFK